MAINLEQVGRIARLANIEISPGEAAQTSAALNGILGLIEQLQSVDTAGITPMAHAQEVAQRLREDCVTEQDQRESFQAVAPETEAGLYLVPRVIE
ncbi:MAG: Asp-tRNA(Asn)/Glu-tRNA(Gln) amidotransferase subunit GatC [Gammaproteobacteria bacterium]|nr:Asp-tRNA(Asn)/Glu-tRNA(Gln) amidotransferase subunit GatC [Gammaproteobacteria bacterium]